MSRMVILLCVVGFCLLEPGHRPSFSGRGFEGRRRDRPAGPGAARVPLGALKSRPGSERWNLHRGGANHGTGNPAWPAGSGRPTRNARCPGVLAGPPCRPVLRRVVSSRAALPPSAPSAVPVVQPCRYSGGGGWRCRPPNWVRERRDGARLGWPGGWPWASPAGTKRESARLEWASRFSRSEKAL